MPCWIRKVSSLCLVLYGVTEPKDLSNFSPAVRGGDPRYGDFSLSQFWVMKNWGHGRGALEWEDPAAYYDSANVWTHIHGQVTLAALQNLTTKAAAASVGGNLVCARLITSSANLFAATGGASRDVFQWDNTNSVWAPETSGITADPTDMAEFQGIVWVAMGDGTDMRRKSGGSWGAAAAGVDAQVLCVFNNMTLYRGTNVNELYWTVDSGATPTWSGPIYVGDTNTPIRAMVVGDGKVWIGKDDGLYYLQNGVVQQLLDFQWARDTNNFRWMKWWQGALYFPIQHGLYRLVGSTLQAIGPNRGAAGAVDTITLGGGVTAVPQPTFKSLASGKRGQIVDLIPVGEFLYAVIDAGTGGTSQILCFNGSGWHQLVQGAASGTRIRAAFFTGPLATTGVLSIPRLWFGYGNDIYNIILPLNTDDPFEDTTNQTYIATTTPGAGTFLRSSAFDAGLANVWKEFMAVHVYSEGLTSTEQCKVLFRVDDEVIQSVSAFQQLLSTSGTAYNFTFSPHQIIPMPQNTIGKKLTVELQPARGTTATLTPKIKAVVVEFMVRPDTKYAWQATVRAGRHMRNPFNNTYEDLDGAEWQQLLARYRESRTRLTWDPGDMEPGITNLVLNPVFWVDSDGDQTPDNWSKLQSPALQQDLQYKYLGRSSLRVREFSSQQGGIESSAITVVAGTRYTASAYLYLATKNVTGLTVSGTDGVVLQIFSGGTVISSTTVLTPTDQWIRVETTVVATSTSLTVRIRVPINATQNNVFFVDAVQLEAVADARFANFGSKASTYCDGDQPRCRWTGQPHLSTSVRDSSYQVFVTNVSFAEAKRPSIMDRVRGRGIEQRVTISLAQVNTGG